MDGPDYVATGTTVSMTMARNALMLALSGIVVLGLSVRSASAQTTSPAPATKPAAAVELGRLYKNSFNGFSLRPPVDTEWQRDSSGPRLVYWARRDPATGAIAWTLSVSRAVDPKEDIDLNVYSKALADKLTQDESLKVEAVRVTGIAGKPAMDLQGPTGGAVRLWKRYVWVMPRTGMFLIFAIVGPADAKERLNSILEAVLGTVQLFDPTAEREAGRQNLQRGEEFLKALGEKQILAAVHAQPQWFLLKLKDQPVGFLYQTESPVRRDGADGVEVRMRIKTQMPGDDVRFARRELFCTPNRSLELWKEDLVIGTGERAVRMVEDGIRQEEMIVCNTVRCNQERTHKKKLGEDIAGVYLPRAEATLLPRLVDLNKKQSYAFAYYNSEPNDFDMRTFAVAGPERIALGGSEVQAFRTTDQLADDVEPAVMWVDSGGMLLRVESSDGLVMEAASKPQVLEKFPSAEDDVKAMEKQ